MKHITTKEYPQGMGPRQSYPIQYVAKAWARSKYEGRPVFKAVGFGRRWFDVHSIRLDTIFTAA